MDICNETTGVEQTEVRLFRKPDFNPQAVAPA